MAILTIPQLRKKVRTAEQLARFRAAQLAGSDNPQTVRMRLQAIAHANALEAVHMALTGQGNYLLNGLAEVRDGEREEFEAWLAAQSDESSAQ